jgi:hypothetical protein
MSFRPRIGEWVNPEIRNVSGRISLLRVHEAGSKYGPPNDELDADVIVQLNTHPDRAFGFQLRNDSNGLVHQGMLQMLMEAYRHNWEISLAFWEYSKLGYSNKKKNCPLFRVWLRR